MRLEDFILIALLLAGYLVAFWYAYVLVMGLYRAHLNDRLTRLTYVLAFPAVVVGYFMDVLANLTIASVVFAEAPRELLVTDRLKRHIASGKGWRAAKAEWICSNLLDVFDPSGNHC